MRLFIAITIPEHSRNLLERKLNIFKKNIKQNLKWVKTENWHLTLKFLGECRENKIAKIKDILKDLSLNNNSFPLKFTGINAFPDFDQPRVIFFDIKKGRKNIIQIHNTMDCRLSELGFERENKKYTPHLTVARSKNNTNLKKLGTNLKKYKKKSFINIYMKAERISLVKSKLTRNGPIYEDIFSINLK